MVKHKIRESKINLENLKHNFKINKKVKRSWLNQHMTHHSPCTPLSLIQKVFRKNASSYNMENATCTRETWNITIKHLLFSYGHCGQLTVLLNFTNYLLVHKHESWETLPKKMRIDILESYLIRISDSWSWN